MYSSEVGTTEYANKSQDAEHVKCKFNSSLPYMQTAWKEALILEDMWGGI